MRTDGGLKSFGDEHLPEKLGRGRAERKRRKLEEKEAEEALSKLLEKDGNNGSTGAKYLAKIGRSVPQTAKTPHKQAETTGQEALDEADRKRPFGVTAVRRIGFDPTARAGQRDDEDQAKRVSTKGKSGTLSNFGARWKASPRSKTLIDRSSLADRLVHPALMYGLPRSWWQRAGIAMKPRTAYLKRGTKLAT